MQTVLIVDDNYDVLETLSHLLEDAGFQVIGTMEARRALQLCDSVDFDVVVTDLYMTDALDEHGTQVTGMAGMDLIWYLHDKHPTLPVIAMTGLIEQANLQNLKRTGIAGVLSKPFSRDELLDEIFKVTNDVDTVPKEVARCITGR